MMLSRDAILYFLFPELDHLTRSEMEKALKHAGKTPFAWLEWFGIISSMAIATFAFEFPPGSYLVENKMILAAYKTLFAVLVGGLLMVPFLTRKMRRGIRKYLSDHSQKEH